MNNVCLTENCDVIYNEAGSVKVMWYEAGEGYYGDFDDEADDDRELLRFDLYILRNRKTYLVPGGNQMWQHFRPESDGDVTNSEFKYIPKGEDPTDYLWDNIESYCTLVPTTASNIERKEMLKIILDRVENDALGGSAKRSAQEASWISLSWSKDPERLTREIDGLSRQKLIDMGLNEQLISELSDGDIKLIAAQTDIEAATKQIFKRIQS